MTNDPVSLQDCAGCTDRHSEGTHAMHTKQHPCPPGGDPTCGYCNPVSLKLDPVSEAIARIDPHNVQVADIHARLSNAVTAAQGAINSEEMNASRIEVFEAVKELAHHIAYLSYARGVEDSARVAEGGRFLHDDAPDARFGRSFAAAIRSLTPNEKKA